MTTSDKPPSSGSVLDKYRRSGGAAPDKPGDDASPIEHKCYTEMPIHVAMIDLQLENGDHVALPYHYLEEVQFNPSTGIKMFFNEREVTITGRNLQPIYAGLTGHRIGRITPATREGLADGNQTVVTHVYSKRLA